MRITRVCLLASVVALNACAAAFSASADNITRLEKATAARPESEAAQRALGIAYFQANRYADARDALDRAGDASAQQLLVHAYLQRLHVGLHHDLTAVTQ